mmetsp:Transcript_53129/g.158987  ORF Transcript_53129/g.158987 Transcript_53129/m.158987 type:complete len:249 (+) Transcript_53129:375-1121(+)
MGLLLPPLLPRPRRPRWEGVVVPRRRNSTCERWNRRTRTRSASSPNWKEGWSSWRSRMKRRRIRWTTHRRRRGCCVRSAWCCEGSMATRLRLGAAVSLYQVLARFCLSLLQLAVVLGHHLCSPTLSQGPTVRAGHSVRGIAALAVSQVRRRLSSLANSSYPRGSLIPSPPPATYFTRSTAFASTVPAGISSPALTTTWRNCSTSALASPPPRPGAHPRRAARDSRTGLTHVALSWCAPSVATGVSSPT